MTEKIAIRPWVGNIGASVDATDHIDFWCPQCKGPMWIESVKTSGRGDDKVTRIVVACDACGIEGQRKGYWNVTLRTPNRRPADRRGTP